MSSGPLPGLIRYLDSETALIAARTGSDPGHRTCHACWAVDRAAPQRGPVRRSRRAQSSSRTHSRKPFLDTTCLVLARWPRQPAHRPASCHTHRGKTFRNTAWSDPSHPRQDHAGRLAASQQHGYDRRVPPSL